MTVTRSAKENIIVMAAVTLMIAAMTWWFLALASDKADPWHGVPECTNQIADEGGICHGEPPLDT